MKIGVKLWGVSLVISLAMSAAPASAAPIITGVGADVTAAPFSFGFLGSTFTFGPGGGLPSILAVSSTENAAVRTVFGSPSPDFVDRGTVTYDANILGGYGTFLRPTDIPFSNGNNFLGLIVTSSGQNYYGFVYSTNTIINSYGFESSPNTAITATTAVPAAVPEPATWAMMILGFAVVGAAMRRRKAGITATVSYV